MVSQPLSLYIHIPYCRTRCLYCDFNTYATSATPWEEYLEALIRELQAYRAHAFWGRPLGTLFFGGGTPSLFPPAFFEALLEEVFASFAPATDLELSMECNPGTVSLEHLQGYRALGFNRLSFGVQSLDPAHLRTLTRLHGREEALEAVALATRAGFQNLSIDLMFGVPGQTLEGWDLELQEALTLPLRHMSVYNLTPEEGTALLRQLQLGRLLLPDEGKLVDMYLHTRKTLRAAGFEPYEISNFSRGAPCRHNLQYWRRGDYLGLGAGAHSFAGSASPPGVPAAHGAGFVPVGAGDPPVLSPGGHRWSNLKRPAAYQDACAEGRLPIEQVEHLSLQDAAAELVLVEGRLMEGIGLERLGTRFGQSARRALEERAQPFVRRGFMQYRNGNERDTEPLEGAPGQVECTSSGLPSRDVERGFLALTDEGVLVANTIIEALSSAVDRSLERDIRQVRPATIR